MDVMGKRLTLRRRDSSSSARIAHVDATSPGNASFGSAMLSKKAWDEIERSLKLSGRELQIARGVFDNLTDGAIAANLRISEHTIHEHLNRLYKKLRVTTRGQMIVRMMHEFLFLTLSQASDLPPLCRNRANGRCPMQD